MTPDDIRAARFASVRKGGYEVREVDTFLANVLQAFERGDGPMGADDVREARFSLVKRGGYDTQQVDAFLDDVMEEFEHMEASAGPAGPTVQILDDPTTTTTDTTATSDSPNPMGNDTEPDSASRAPHDLAAEAPAAPLPTAATTPGPESADASATAGITSAQLRRISPPRVDGVGYDIDEVDGFLGRVADTLEVFEQLSGNDLLRVRATQYMLGANGAPVLLSTDHVRSALFAVRDAGGYDARGVDIAVRRLSKAIDYHWNRQE